VPSLRYKLVVPAYSNELVDPDGAGAPGPGGGFSWDGRANTLAEQAALPLLSRFEMANRTPDAVVVKVRAASYSALFAQAFGRNALTDSRKAFANVTLALQAFQLEDPSFRPYSSKFDLYNQRGLGKLSAAELRGKAVFNDPNRGNCAACHIPDLNQFTDHMFAAIGVPRNRALAASGANDSNDMGLCGQLRDDLRPGRKGAPNRYCGMFKTPTLRNVATRRVFFHNGVMTSLEQAVNFYNTRDTHPEIWYPTVGGKALATASADFPTGGLITTQYRGGRVQKYDDLPAAYTGNIDVQMPLDGRAAGAAAPMKEQEVADLICFLRTLDDGFTIPAKEPVSGPCVH
jgi:cytochrome c peroxidase